MSSFRYGLSQKTELNVPVDCLALQPEREILVCGCSNGSAVLLDTRNKETISSVTPTPGSEIGAAVWHPTDSHSFYLSIQKQILQFDSRAFSPNPISTLEFSQDDVGSLDINPEGTLLASGDDNGDVILVDLTTRQLQLTTAAHVSLCTAVKFSPYAENEIFSGGMDCTVKSWDIDTSEPFWEETMKQQSTETPQIVNPPMIFDLAVPEKSDWDGLMAAACGDGSVFLRIDSESDQGTSALISDPIDGHRSAASSVVFVKSSEGERVISGGNDGNVILWKWTAQEDHMQWKKTLPSQINALCTHISSRGQEQLFLATQTGLYFSQI